MTPLGAGAGGLACSLPCVVAAINDLDILEAVIDEQSASDNRLATQPTRDEDRGGAILQSRVAESPAIVV